MPEDDISQYLGQYQDNIAALDQEKTGPGKPKRPAKPGTVPQDITAFVTSERNPLPVTQRTPISGGAPGLLDIESYIGYMPSGVHTERDDLDLMRAQAQGFWESTGRRLGNFIPNVAAGVVENAGYLGALLTEWGDDRDYSNALTELAQQMKNPVGQVYRENPNATWDMGDPAWWGENFFGLAESISQFAITGMGVGSVFNNLAKAAAIGARSAKVGAAIGQGLTASTLAYTEGAMSGARVYQTTYENQLQRFISEGMDPEEAKAQANSLASNAAATTVQLNTALATVLNLTSVAPMFRRNDEILDWFRSTGQRARGESLKDWTARIAGGSDEAARMLQGSRLGAAARFGGEAAQEGTEELVNQFAENTGLAQGESGKKLGMLEQFGELSQFFNRTMDSEGALNFVLGALGGAGNTVVMENAPIHRVPVSAADGSIQRTEDGKPVMSWVSARTRDAMGAKRYYENITQAIEKDVDWYNQKTKDLAKAVADNNAVEAERLKTQIFDSQNYWSIMNGLGESWQNEMDDIAALDNTKTMTEQAMPELQRLMAARAESTDPQEQADLNDQIAQLNEAIAQHGNETEASKRGFSKGVGDDMYKVRAAEMKADIGKLTKLWEDVQAKYNTPEMIQLGFPDFLFGREADLFRRQNIIERAKKNIQALEAEFSAKYTGADRADLLFISQLTSFDGLNQAYNDLNRDIDVLDNGKDMPAVEASIERVGGSKDVTDLEAARKSASQEAKSKRADLALRMQVLEENILGLPDFRAFREKNPDKAVKDLIQPYIQAQVSQVTDLKNISTAKAHLERFQADTDMAAKNLDYFKTHKGQQDFLKTMKRANDDRARERYNRAQASTLSHERAEMERRAAAEIEQQQRERAEKYGVQRLHGLQQTRAALVQEITTLTKQIAGEMVRQNWSTKFRNWREKKDPLATQKQTLRELEVRKTYVEAQIQEALKNLTIVDPNGTPVPAPVPQPAAPEAAPTAVDAVDNAEDDLITFMMQFDPKVRDHLNNRLNHLMTLLEAGQLESIPGDYYAPEVAAGQLTPDQAATFLALSRKEFDAIQQIFRGEAEPVTEEDILAEEAEAAEEAAPVTATIEDFADDGQPDSVPFSEKTEVPSEARMTELREGPDPSHEGAKLLNINSIANMALPYEEVELDSKFMMINAKTAIREGYPEQMLRPEGLTPGHPIEFQVDTHFNGTVSKGTEFPEWEPEGAIQVASKYDDYLDPRTGQIKDIDNVPIKIIDGMNGQTLGYVHRVAWLNAKYPGASNFRNVVDQVTDKDGNVIELMNNHRDLLRNIRQTVVNNFNKGVPSFGKVLSTGPGQVITTKTKKGNRIVYPTGNVKRRFPATNLAMGIITGEVVKVGKNVEAEDQGMRVTIPTAEFTNVPGLLLPMYDGTHRFEPIRMRNLNETDINSAARAIELFLLKRAGDPTVDGEITKILEVTGFNVATPKGVRQYINQYYTYSEKFSQADTEMNAALMKKNGTAKPFFMIDMRDDGDIKVGWKFGGAKPQWARLQGGQLHPLFREALVEGLLTRPKNVTMQNDSTGLRGINSNGEFREVQYTKSGRWTAKNHLNYNEYLKDKATTSAIGTNQTSDGTYVYAVNPSVQFEVQDLLNAEANGPVENTRTTQDDVTQPPSEGPITDAELNDVLNLFGDMMKLPPPVNTVGVNPEATELSLSELERKFNFTEPQQRNGKTPAQVYEEMVRAGIGQIAEGVNPFIKCG